MKKLLLCAIICINFFEPIIAQNRYVVFLSDKNGSPYSVGNPSAFLSPRAITRRTIQSIAITSQDFPVNPSYVSGIQATGAQVLNTSRWFNSVTVEVSNNSILNAINALPYVSQALNVGRTIGPVHPSKFNIENTREAAVNLPENNRTSSTFNYGPSFNQVSMLKGDLMHDNGYVGTGKVIAVLDAGFFSVNTMPAFDSLFANNRVLATWDFVDNEANVYDDDQHGTMVLSLMGANVPGEIIGTAPGASYLLLRSENAPAEALIEEYNWASAAEYADSAGADVINSSLGYTEFDDPAQNHTYSDLDGNTTPISIAADIAASKGIVVCNSAGNEGNGSWFHISAPADADSILAVGAVDAFEVYAQFSGKGPSADGNVKPNVAAQGSQTFVVDPWTGSGVFPGNGTSFASPLMAGMVAALWQCHPNVTNMQIINAIQQSASQFSSPDSLLGYGIPDFPEACLILAGIDPGVALNGDNLIVNGNPFAEHLSLSFYSTKQQDIKVKLTDMLGKLIYNKSLSVSGLNVHDISVPVSVSKGIYVIEVETELKVFTEKVIKK